MTLKHLAALRLDFEEFVSTLTEKRAAVLLGAMHEEKVGDTAERMGLSSQVVSYPAPPGHRVTELFHALAGRRVYLDLLDPVLCRRVVGYFE